MSARATSLAARSSTRPAANQRLRVFMFVLVRLAHGATLEEIEEGLGLPGNTVRPRRIELEKKGFIVDSYTTRPTTRGRDATVWVVPEPRRTKALEKLHLKGIIA